MRTLMPRLGSLAVSCLMALGYTNGFAATEPVLPLFDAHLHYSHDAAELIPPEKALGILGGDSDFTKFIYEDGGFDALLILKDVIEECRLTATEKSSNNRDRD